jgi:murein DD-endopeptidase MepM/ murein hydrolase activator NlpD
MIQIRGRWLILTVLGLIMIGALTYLLLPRRPSVLPSPNPITSPSPTLSPSPSPEASPSPSPSPSASPTVYYPIKNYAARITNRGHGKTIVASDNKVFPCGAEFSGLHAGDDLEVFEEEIDEPIVVYAIADGTVRQAKEVGGYGGLIVIDHNLNGQVVTAYYGHVSLSKSKVKDGDKVTAGQPITVLGDQCSNETSNERKHLHFAIHKGTDLDVRGYVPTQGELAAWIDPKATLADLKAAEPFISF